MPRDALRSAPKIVEPLSTISEATASALCDLKSEITVNLTNIQKSSEEKLTNLFKLFEERILQYFSDITAEVANLRTELFSTKNQLADVTKKCKSIESDLCNARDMLNTYENSLCATDIVVGNVPNNQEAATVVNTLLSKIACQGISVRKVFRTHKHSENKKSVPIIVKLHSADDRVKVFQSIAQFRKLHNKQLLLSDLGISGDTSLYVHECLTTLNRELLRSALQYKSTKLLASAFYLRGAVLVRVKSDGKAIKVNSLEELTKIVGGA